MTLTATQMATMKLGYMKLLESQSNVPLNRALISAVTQAKVYQSVFASMSAFQPQSQGLFSVINFLA